VFFFLFPKIISPSKKLGGLIYKWRRYLTFQQLNKKTSYRSLSYKKFHKRQNDGKGGYSGAFLRKFQKSVSILKTYICD